MTAFWKLMETPILPPFLFVAILISSASAATGNAAKPLIHRNTPVTPELHLNFHLMHPGPKASPADPNAGLCVNGVCHFHYIYHPGGKPNSFTFAHVSSKDMPHWEWKPTNPHPDFTGHGMFSGTEFLTKEGKPAVIYHGQNSGSNQPANPKNPNVARVINGDPDCFRVGGLYHAIFGNRIGQVGEVPYLATSADAVEIRAVFNRARAQQARFGFDLFSDKPGGSGFLIRIQPDSGTIRVGVLEARFAVADLPPGQDLELRSLSTNTLSKSSSTTARPSSAGTTIGRATPSFTPTTDSNPARSSNSIFGNSNPRMPDASKQLKAGS